MKRFICKYCDKETSSENPWRQFCSVECSQNYIRLIHNRRTLSKSYRENHKDKTFVKSQQKRISRFNNRKSPTSEDAGGRISK